jgi:hypothetical protein
MSMDECERLGIIVNGIWPPIPTHAFDYCAMYDGDEPDDAGHMRAGYGKTAEDAIADLRNSYPRSVEDRIGMERQYPGDE